MIDAVRIDDITAELRAEVERLRALLVLALSELESYEVMVEGEWGAARTLAQIEADGDLSKIVIRLRTALAADAGRAAEEPKP